MISDIFPNRNVCFSCLTFACFLVVSCGTAFAFQPKPGAEVPLFVKQVVLNNATDLLSEDDGTEETGLETVPDPRLIELQTKLDQCEKKLAEYEKEAALDGEAFVTLEGDPTKGRSSRLKFLRVIKNQNPVLITRIYHPNLSISSKWSEQDSFSNPPSTTPGTEAEANGESPGTVQTITPALNPNDGIELAWNEAKPDDPKFEVEYRRRVPKWKIQYRLDTKTGKIEAWAIIYNRTAYNWNNIPVFLRESGNQNIEYQLENVSLKCAQAGLFRVKVEEADGIKAEIERAIFFDANRNESKSNPRETIRLKNIEGPYLIQASVAIHDNNRQFISHGSLLSSDLVPTSFVVSDKKKLSVSFAPADFDQATHSFPYQFLELQRSKLTYLQATKHRYTVTNTDLRQYVVKVVPVGLEGWTIDSGSFDAKLTKEQKEAGYKITKSLDEKASKINVAVTNEFGIQIYAATLYLETGELDVTVEAEQAAIFELTQVEETPKQANLRTELKSKQLSKIKIGAEPELKLVETIRALKAEIEELDKQQKELSTELANDQNLYADYPVISDSAVNVAARAALRQNVSELRLTLEHNNQKIDELMAELDGILFLGVPEEPLLIANQAILDEANQSGRWFHAKKVKPLWAKEALEETTFETLEGIETVSPGDFLCRGEVGDVWPQSAKSLLRKYDPTDETDDGGWRLYTPKPDAEGVMAIQINHPFDVQASWGDLKGKAGDFLLKNFSDKETQYPEDVWIVDQTIFNSTYQPVEANFGNSLPNQNR